MMWHVGAEEQVTTGREALIGREVDAAVDALRRAHPRALDDNPDGLELIGEAVRRAIGLGLDAGCKRVGVSATELDYARADAWESWRRQRERTLDSNAWPAELEAVAPEVVEEGRALLVAAGAELGLRGRSARALRQAGGQASEAGAALVRALAAGPSPAGAPPRSATAAPVGAVEPDGTVRVAVAANLAEAELLQGVLVDAGIPSTWRRTGGDLPELLAAGYREIYVPADAADEAQALLATVEATSADEPDVAPTRRIGLERTGLRLFGKVTVILFLAGILTGLAIGFALDEPEFGLAVLAAVLLAGVALLVWSERAGPA
jgi:hypothetical protein